MKDFSKNGTRIETKSLLKRASAVFSTKLFIYFIGLFSSIYIARAIGAEEKGILAVSTSIVGIISQFANIGMHSAHTYYISKDPCNADKCVGNNIFICLLTFCLSIVVAFLAFSQGHFSDLGLVGLFVSFISGSFALFVMLQENIFVALNKIRHFNMIEYMNASMVIFLVLCYSLFGNIDCFVVIMATFVSYCIIGLYSLIVYFSIFKGSKFTFSFSYFVQILPYGIKAYLACLFAYLLLRIDILMLDDVVSNVELGQYSLAVNLSDMLYMLASSISLIMFPDLCSLDSHKKKYEYIVRLYKVLFVVIFMVAVLMEIFGGVVVNLLYGKEYLGAIPALRILIISTVFWSLSSFAFVFLASIDKNNIAIGITILALLCNVILNHMLIPIVGIIGAAIASVLSYGFCLIALVIYMYINREKY